MTRRWLRYALPATLVLVGLAIWQRWYIAYLTQAGLGQAKLLWNTRPIADVLRDPKVATTTRHKLELVQQAKEFAITKLGLHPSRSYTTFADIGAGPVSYALTACPAERLEYYRWWFPVVGWVPYLGFFHKALAEEAEQDMQRRGYDTDVREVPAYSTLGWFADPVTSPMLRYGDHDIVATIIHELTHGTLYLPGQGDFNESLANLIGMRGAIEFYCARNSADCSTARQSWADTLAFAGFIDQLYHRLDQVLSQPGDRSSKLEAKARFMATVPAEFAAWQEKQARKIYARFGKRKLNNAVILSLYLYYRHLRLFEEAYQHRHVNLKEFLTEVRQAVTGAADPIAAVQSLAR